VDTARQIFRQSLRSLLDELGARIGRGRISDAGQLAWRSSISGFYEGLRAGKLSLDLEFGAEVVRMCERITEDVAIRSGTPPRPVAADPASRLPGDVAVLGGSGFLGRHVVRRLLDAGLRVDVMARNTRALPALFHEERVQVFPGDVSRPEDVDRFIKGARYVVDLAFSFGDETWEFMERVGIGGARNVAESCGRHGVERLVYASTIAALYLGRNGDVITGGTRPDPKPETRGHYSRAKGACEEILLEAHASSGLPVCILRPGIVVGEGGTPYHGGVALFPNKQHALGKNAGNNPLPFVLAEDCADFYLATRAPDALGRCYNLVSDVRLTARDYIDELSRALERPISFRPRSPQILKAIDTLKWLGQRASGRREPFPSFRSIQSAAVYSHFDTTDIKRDLAWVPVSDRDEFIRRGIEVHRQVC
jgi:nucleoside-diphosphate-sugar epimerase